jgi:hypothetical protein
MLEVETITKPGWLAEVVARFGAPVEQREVPGADRLRQSWKWTVGAEHLLVALVHLDDPTERVLYVEFKDATARLKQDREFTDGQVLHQLRAAGVLPGMVRAIDSDHDAHWFTPDDEPFFLPFHESPGPNDRPLWVEDRIP